MNVQINFLFTNALKIGVGHNDKCENQWHLKL